MIIHSQQVFNKFYLDTRDNPSEFMEYVSSAVERVLGTEVIDKLKNHKTYVVKLHDPEFIEDLSDYGTCKYAYRQDLECKEVIQCKDCRMVYPWCQKFRDELGGNGFCPYGKPAEVLNIGFDEAKEVEK